MRPHATSEEIAGFLDGRLTAPDERRFQDHLADCTTCRAEVVDARRLLAATLTWRRVARGAPGAVAGLLIAAALAAILLVPPDAGPGSIERTRADPEPTDSRTILLVDPVDGVAVPAEEMGFAWRASGTGAAYRFTFADEVGVPLWSVSTSDTSVVLPPELQLTPGSTYLWRVDGLLPDGRTLHTNVQRVIVLP